jgi:hypothetical protein
MNQVDEPANHAILLDMEWGETPFTYGPNPWPYPLIRPESYPDGADPVFYGPKITVPEETWLRWQAVEREFLAVQAELTALAIKHGQLDPGESQSAAAT